MNKERFRFLILSHSKMVSPTKALCEERDDSPGPELSRNDIMINEIKTYATLRGSITNQTCPLQFYKLSNSKYGKNLKNAILYYSLFCPIRMLIQ